MRAAKATLRVALTGFLLGALLAPTATPAQAATPAPGWTLTLTPLPANFAPGGQGEVLAMATNVGAGPATGMTSFELELPPGVVPIKEKTGAENSDPTAAEDPICLTDEVARTVNCETEQIIGSGRFLLVGVDVQVSAPEGTYEADAKVLGGGGGETRASMPVTVQSEPIPFGFLAGYFADPATGEGAEAATLAGSHPSQLTTQLGFPTKNPGDGLTNDGHPKYFSVKLPRGLVGDPGATPVLCTEAELTGGGGCPLESQVGITDVTTLLGAIGFNAVSTTRLFNMVPPPGVAAEIATNVADAGVYVHILASVRTEDDYGVSAEVRDLIAFGTQPIFNAQAQVWGDPSAESHQHIRGECKGSGKTCPAEPAETPFLTMPGECSGGPLLFEALTRSWEDPETYEEALYEGADLQGNPAPIEGCGELPFEPSIEARPTTDHAESPAGLDFHLHQPQEPPREDPLAGRATATLKDATVAFPADLQVNPSQAAGLDACSEAQIGYKGQGEGTLHFSAEPQSCPDAAKLGTVEAASPLLVQRDIDHKVLPNPETGAPLPRPLKGSIYLAKPYANPFGSLVAVYLTVEDPASGIVAKIAGEGELDPGTGQITTRFRESPEVPIEDIAVHLFAGDRSPLITPASCATYTTTAELTPWSAPQGAAASPSDSFAVDKAAAGGPCPASSPNAPVLRAGTLEPAAGKYSPLVFELSREDGSERFGRVEATLPPGLTAKLAGVAQCPQADIAKAISREAPNQGAAELADPSCPAQSRVGAVDVAAGAGPHPFHIAGTAYMAGPYEGAPLSFAIVTPAVAGPFDLGTVVVRTPVYLDPETARVRAVSDPLPQVIDGVPADVRKVTLRIDRPGFTLNPTSCAEKAFEGTATSALGHPALLFQRFQVGGCKSLPYKPKLSARLFGPIHRGGHPRFRAVLRARPGEANTAAFAVTLPRSEFIDQAHFRTICTRVQFAANQCPAGSVYGHVKAISPLVDYPLEGPIYLRSSSHQLPDAVAALRGPPSQPVEIDAVARIDSVKGGLRARVETVPDAPVSKVIVTLQGAKKGLFQNSTNICKGTFRMSASFTGQNGKAYDTKPKLNAQCAKGKGGKGKMGH